jgi:hypothetical protein
MSVYVQGYLGMNPSGSFVAGWITRKTTAALAVGGIAARMSVVAVGAHRRYPEVRES